jgi:chemotaxis protein CheX
MSPDKRAVMITQESTRIHRTDLIEIVSSVFATMLSLDVQESTVPWCPDQDRLTSAVYLTGDWNGAVLVEADRHQARQFAGRFLSIQPPETVNDVVRDVFGELANMIGGNLKCVLTKGIRLSVPSVVDGSNYSVRVCGAEVAERITLHWAEGTFWITVLIMPVSE